MDLGYRFDGLSREVRDLEGGAETLGAVLGSGPVVVVFVRHFGCVGCDMQVAGLMPRQPELSDLGFRIVLIGSGSVDHGRSFVARWALDERHVTVVTDPNLDTFRAAGLVRSAWATFGPQALFSELLAIGAGHLPRRRSGDRFQQGGTLLLDEARRVVFFHANRFVGDCVRPEDLIDAAIRLRLTVTDDVARRAIL